MSRGAPSWSYMPLDADSRFGLATENLLRGDVRGVGQSLVDPKSLSPRQAGLIEGEGWRPKGDDAFSKFLRGLANPLVVLGAVLAIKYPVPTAENLFKWSKNIVGYDKWLTPLVWRAQGAESIFRGTPFLEYLTKFTEHFDDFRKGLILKMGEGLYPIEKALGRGVNFQEQAAAALAREGLQDASRGQWQMIRKMVAAEVKHGNLPEEALSELAFIGTPGKVALESMTPAGLQETLSNTFGEGLSRIMKAMEGATDPKTITAFKKHLTTMGMDGEAEYAFLEEARARGAERLRQAGFEVLDRYYPHYEHLAPGARDQMVRSFLADTQSVAEAKTLSESVPGLSSHGHARLGGMIMDPDDFVHVKDAFHPATEKWLTELGKLKKYYDQDGRLLSTAQEIADAQRKGVLYESNKYRRYSLRAVNVAQHYAHSMGRTVAWTLEGWGPALQKEVQMMSTHGGNPLKTRLAVDTYLPLAAGRLTPDEAMYSLGWSSWKKNAYDFFRNEKIAKALGSTKFDKEGAPLDGAAAWFRKQIASPAIQDLSWKSAGAKLAGHFYLGTLGFNAPSAALNMMQNLVTTAGVVEPRHLFKGFRTVLGKVEQMASMVGKNGRSLEQAFQEVFPEYEALGGGTEVEALSAIRKAVAGGQGTKSTYESVKTALMGLFTGSERFNRLWAYHAGLSKASAEGLVGESANSIARGVVRITQFNGGLTTRPAGTMGWWAPLQQFMTFPFKMGELAFSHGLALGSGAQAIPESFPVVGGMNPGTLGRMTLASGLLYAAGNAAGVQLPGMWEALPAPHGEDQPFYPAPLVPPVLQIPGALAADLFSGGGEQGNWARSRRALTYMVPGGIALSRAASAISPKAARFLGREYADYSQQMPDGSVPVFSSDGSLKGYKSKMRIIADAVGFKSMMGDSEAELTSYLVKQRDRMRGIRREYIEAIASNQMQDAYEINERYKREYPGLGDIAIKSTDVQAVHMRHDLTRVERVLQTMPPEARSQFAGMVNVALGDSAEQMMGVDPALFQKGLTTRQRDAYRKRPQGAGTQRVQQFAKQGGVLRNDELGHRRSSLSPFEGFESY